MYDYDRGRVLGRTVMLSNLSVTKFKLHFVHPYDVNEGIECLSTCASPFVYLVTPISLKFTSTKKSYKTSNLLL